LELIVDAEDGSKTGYAVLFISWERMKEIVEREKYNCMFMYTFDEF
jgi:hypothetical protein